MTQTNPTASARGFCRSGNGRRSAAASSQDVHNRWPGKPGICRGQRDLRGRGAVWTGEPAGDRQPGFAGVSNCRRGVEPDRVAADSPQQRHSDRGRAGHSRAGLFRGDHRGDFFISGRAGPAPASPTSRPLPVFARNMESCSTSANLPTHTTCSIPISRIASASRRSSVR